MQGISFYKEFLPFVSNSNAAIIVAFKHMSVNFKVVEDAHLPSWKLALIMCVEIDVEMTWFLKVCHAETMTSL